MGFFFGQLLGFLVMAALIYYPFLNPLFKINNKQYVLNYKKDVSNPARFKFLMTFLAMYHFLLAIIQFGFSIYSLFTDQNAFETFGVPIDYKSHLLIIVAYGIILFCLGKILVYLEDEKPTENIKLKLAFILPYHSLIGIFISFIIWGIFFFNYNQKVISFIFIAMALVEIYYVIANYVFIKSNEISWKKLPKINSSNDYITTQVRNKNRVPNIRFEKTEDGIELEIRTNMNDGYTVGDEVFINGQPAPDEVYKIGWMSFLTVKDGLIKVL